MSVETLTYTALAERLKISPEAAGGTTINLPR